MSKYLLSFRLYEPEPIVIRTKIGPIKRLTRQEKYDKLIEYLESISLEDSVEEDDTTSLIFFDTIEKNLDVIPGEIIKNCRLLNNDELFFIEFDGERVFQDCRILNREIVNVNNFKTWVS